jgi:hypothetical protein
MIIGIAILIVGSIIGFFGAATPSASAFQQSVSLVNTPLNIAPNDYAAQSLQMTMGETIQITLSIDNQTLFTFDIMNQSQFYIYNNCAPKCAQPMLGGSGSYYLQAGEVTPSQLNVTVSPSAPYSGSFTAPFNGTYYFVFDNSIGPSWSAYLGQNATGHVAGEFSLSSTQLVTTYSIDWSFVGIGAGITLVGGAIATIMWFPKNILGS